MTIVGILMAVGVPSYRYVTTGNRVTTEVNALLADLQYARSEAVRQGQSVSVCVAQSTSPATCAAAGTTTWQNGWIIFSDVNNDATIDAGDPVLRIQNPFTSSDTLVSGGTTPVTVITFNRDGFAHIGSAFNVIKLNDSSNNQLYERCLEITQAGMMTTQTNSSDPTNCQ